MITTLPKLSPNLREICLEGLPRETPITLAVSELVLNTKENSLLIFDVDSPLTEQAYQVLCKHTNLRRLCTTIDKPNPLSTMALPNLVDMSIQYYHSHDWLESFHGASFGKLASFIVFSESDAIGDFLGAFETAALTTSIPASLTTFQFNTERPWRPTYRSLLPFTQLTMLIIESPCTLGCSSTIDDDSIVDLARAMPKLRTLSLGDKPCQTPGGVTVKGLTALAHHCLHLSSLCIHFQVATLDPPQIPIPASVDESTVSREGCALSFLQAGWIRVPEKSTLMVALTLLGIFPHLESIGYNGRGWKTVSDAIRNSKNLIRCSGKKDSFVTLRAALMTPR